MSTLDVVAEVLREVAPRALNARQIVELAKGRLPTASRTPETVVSRDLAMETKRNGARSRFLRAAPGEFLLKEALPTAFYNELSPYPAQWSRNLIAAGEIAAGVVDERSIRDLKPADVASYRQCHFFAGLGTWSRAVRDAGWPDNVHLWSGSCPCTDFSSAGRRRGFEGDHHLWPDWFRLISACRPSIVVGEQSSSALGGAWLDLVFDELEGAGYSCRAFDTPAASIGAPHRRQRFYFVAYARERAGEILEGSWLRRIASAVSNAASTRLSSAEDTRADRGDAIACVSSGRLESERSGDADGAVATVGLGNTRLARGGWDAGALPRAEGVGEGEWIEAGDLPDESVAPSPDDSFVGTGGFSDGGLPRALVRGADGVAGGFRPGDRIRIDGDPGWGGAVRGFWAEDVEWIYCRPEPGHENGRWRPAQSGIEPLAPRTSSDLGRTRSKRLMAYGNSIVLPLAMVFVEAVIETFAEAARKIEGDVEPTPELPPWTGPREGETAPSGMLYGRVPVERWPYGPPPAHESSCNLFPHRGSPGGLFCDCAASAIDGIAWGVGA